ncbi:MAG: TIM barrel protein [Planctomycetota bacterium]|nr:TIM barrel protein [Planctomycetota bacterium]
MFVAATSRCFHNLPLDAALSRLVDLQFTAVEIMIHETDGHIKPAEVATDLEQVVQLCRQTHRLTPIAFSFDTNAPEEEAYRQFSACCKLAKATKVIAITVRSSELGTPFNGEVERLRKLVSIAAPEGVVVGLQTETNRISQDPGTITTLCDNVKGLGITLDPSQFILGQQSEINYDKLIKDVIHVRLRDTSKEEFQIRVGQGEVEYGRLVTLLSRAKYNRALCVDIVPVPDIDQNAEMRKIRLLLESLL